MWKPKPNPQPTPTTSDDLRGQNIDPGNVPAVNWDGTNPGKQPLLGTDRDPKKVA